MKGKNEGIPHDKCVKKHFGMYYLLRRLFSNGAIIIIHFQNERGINLNVDVANLGKYIKIIFWK